MSNFCVNCGSSMVGGDGTPYSAVLHCEFVDVDLNIPHDADPVYCSAEGLDAAE